jgi:hypothetical protein
MDRPEEPAQLVLERRQVQKVPRLLRPGHLEHHPIHKFIHLRIIHTAPNLPRGHRWAQFHPEHGPGAQPPAQAFKQLHVADPI